MQDELTEGKRDPRADTPLKEEEVDFGPVHSVDVFDGDATHMHRREDFEVDLTTCKGKDVTLPTSTLINMLAQNALEAAIRMEKLEEEVKVAYAAADSMAAKMEAANNGYKKLYKENRELATDRDRVTDELIDLKAVLESLPTLDDETLKSIDVIFAIDHRLGEGWTRNLLGALIRAAK